MMILSGLYQLNDDDDASIHNEPFAEARTEQVPVVRLVFLLCGMSKTT
jgi:hypothetical protein